MLNTKVIGLFPEPCEFILTGTNDNQKVKNQREYFEGLLNIEVKIRDQQKKEGEKIHK